MRLDKSILFSSGGKIPTYDDIEYERVCWNCGRPVPLGNSHCECGATEEIIFRRYME